jgi:hypothetical protein
LKSEREGERESSSSGGSGAMDSAHSTERSGME